MQTTNEIERLRLVDAGTLPLGTVVTCKDGHKWVFIGVFHPKTGTANPSFCFHPEISVFGAKALTYFVVYLDTAERKFPGLKEILLG